MGCYNHRATLQTEIGSYPAFSTTQGVELPLQALPIPVSGKVSCSKFCQGASFFVPRGDFPRIHERDYWTQRPTLSRFHQVPADFCPDEKDSCLPTPSVVPVGHSFSKYSLMPIMCQLLSYEQKR